MTRPWLGPVPAAERQARYRESGRQIAVVLRDPAALARLDALVELHGSIRAALEHAIKAAPAVGGAGKP